MSADQTTVTHDDRATLDKLERVWGSLDELCSSLDDAEWDLPTDCPGWSVKDNLSHIVGTESNLLGRPAPEHTPADMSRARNPIGEANEVQVDYRRSWPPAKVLEEFREVTGERLRQMRGWPEEEFAKESWTPVGPGQVRDFLQIRIFDSWVHEQDIRRATNRPGHLEGIVAEHAFGRVAMAMPFVVGKKAGTPDGTDVLFVVTGPAGGQIPVTVEGGRANQVAGLERPDVTLEMDLETFNCLGCGRWDAQRALADGRLRIAGDEALGRTIASSMAFMI